MKEVSFTTDHLTWLDTHTHAVVIPASIITAVDESLDSCGLWYVYGDWLLVWRWSSRSVQAHLVLLMSRERTWSRTLENSWRTSVSMSCWHLPRTSV